MLRCFSARSSAQSLDAPLPLVIVLLGLATAWPAAADLTYLAFGDSITLSTGCPVDCGANFDEANKGGYPGRLQTRLGGSNRVENHGKGGERTAQGVSRITAILDGGGDVLLLMEGTNDIEGGISKESIRANLDIMIDKATARGIDAAIATTIRRIYAANHTPTQNLATEIRDLAGDIKRDLVDPYLPLCPSDSCFDAHYYQGDLDIGHIDASGYEIMTDLFEDVIRADPRPGIPTPVSPSGDTDKRPTYTWNTGANANWYRLQVEDPSNLQVVNEFYEHAVVCSGGSCSATPRIDLDDGEHRFRVRPRNLFNWGTWSRWETFEVYATVPAEAVATAPSGEFYDSDPIRFTYEWVSQDDATEYRLQVRDALKVNVINTVVDGGDVCNASSCSYRPSEAIGGGDYTWKVRGQNPAGNGAYSVPLALTVWDSPPAVPEPRYPIGELFDTTPRFEWSAVRGATSYRVDVYDSAENLEVTQTFDASVCTESECGASLTSTLTPADYHWTVRSTNPVGTSAASSELDFEVLLCESPEDVTLSPQTITGTKTFRACGTLTLGDGVIVAANANVTFLAGDKVVIEDGFVLRANGNITVLSDH